MSTFRCGGCAGVVQAGAAEPGGRVTCRRCGHVNICPAPSTPVEAQVSHQPVRDSRTFWLAGGAIAVVLVAFVAWATVSPAEPLAASKATGTPVEQRQRALLDANLDQPGDATLGELYARINARHFKGGLPTIPVRWEARLDEVGQLAEGAFTLEGMFGHVGSKAIILLNPGLQSNDASLRRALCHEMVHAQLYVAGQATEKHGPAFQAILQRLLAEGAFEGVVSTDADRSNLRTWLDFENTRLDEEQEALRLEASDLDRERVELEALLSNLNARMTTAAAPDENEVRAYNARRERYNSRVSQAQARADRGRSDREYFNREVQRYNLMLVYPDGMDEGTVRIKK